MARYAIQGPDGKKYAIEGPDGASEDEILTFAEQQFGGENVVPSEPPKPKQQAEVRAYEPTMRDQIGSFFSDMLGNSTMGDRAVSGVMGSTGLGHNRMGVVDFTPARIPLFAQEAKRSYDAGNMGDAALNALGATPAPIVSKGIEAFANVAKPAVQAAGRGLTAAQARLPQVLTGKGADDVADAVIAGRLQRSGQSADTVAEDLAAGQRSARMDSNSRATLPETIADTSQDMQRLAGSVYRTGGEAGEIMKPGLDFRQKGPANFFAERADDLPQGQIERIIDGFDRALGVKSSKGARATSTELVAAQKAKSEELYAKAEKLSEDFDLNGVATAWHLKAQDYQGDFRKKLTAAIDLFTQPAGSFTRYGANTVKRFDNAKKVLDDMIENSKGEFGKATNLTRELTGLKNDLLAQVHAGGKNKYYQQARDEFGTAAENLEAIELGRKAFREDSEVSVATLRSLTPAQQKLFRIGSRDGVRLTMATKKPGDNATLPFQQRRVRELLDEMIPVPKKKDAEFADRAERFGDVMRREERMSETRNRVLGGSPTGERLADDAEFASDALSRALTGGRSMLNMGLELVGSGLQKAFGYRRDVAASLARKLMDGDPATQAQTLAAIRAQQSPQAFSEFAEGLQRAFPRAVPPMTPAAQAERPNDPPKNFRPPMRLGGPKPDDSLPGVPQGVDGTPGPSSAQMDEMKAKADKERADKALVRYGDQTLIPGLSEIAGTALDAVSNAGEAMMAFGPMGHLLDAPLQGAGAVVRSMRAKPPTVAPNAAPTLDQESKRIAEVVRRRKEAEAVKKAADRSSFSANQAEAASKAGSTGTVPATANTRKVIEEIETNRAGRPIANKPGLRSVDEQVDAVQKAAPPAIVQGPWGPNMAASVREALLRGKQAREAQSVAPKAASTGEAADRPATKDIMRAYALLKKEADGLRQQISAIETDKAITSESAKMTRGVARDLRDQLTEVQAELLRLQQATKDKPSKFTGFFKRGGE